MHRRYAPPLCTAMHDALLWGYRYAPLCTAMRRRYAPLHRYAPPLCTAMHDTAMHILVAMHDTVRIV